jgi:predicted dehydrogenase
MRGALIGCGFFAQNHLNAWRDLRADGIELVAVCDIDPAKAQAAATNFGIPRHYTDAAALLEAEKLDYVDIATRADTHYDVSALAFARGIPAIIQKPLARDWREAVSIVDNAAGHKVEMAVHENFRFQAPMLALKRVLDSGVIGEVSWARIAFRTGYDIYRTQPYFHHEPRFAILDVGIHVLDLARWFLGEVEHVSCETQRRNVKNIGEDTATMMMRHKSGVVSLVECTYESREQPDWFPQTLIAIEGERGAIRMLPDLRMAVTVDGARTETDVGTPLLSWTSHPWHVAQESVVNTQRDIIGAWRQGKRAATSGDDNLKTFALVEAAYSAADAKRAIAPLR